MMHGSGHVMRGFNGFNPGFMGYGQNGMMGWIPLAFHLVFFVAILVLAAFLMRRHAAKVRTYRKLNDPALLILRERYALGELETEEFVRRKNDLTN